MFHLVDSQAIYIVTLLAAKHVFLRGFTPLAVMQAIVTALRNQENLRSHFLF